MASLQEARAWLDTQIATRGGSAGDLIDSLAGVELILEAETAFGIKVPQSAITSATCSSLGELATLISNLSTAGSAA